MSRSKRGGKPPGYDFWSRRPFSGFGSGKIVKKLTHAAERAISKREIYKEMKDKE